MRKLLLGATLLFAAILNAQPRKVKITELEQLIRDSNHPLIVNFWATWCMPCIEEIPYFQKAVLANKKDSLELILVSLDMKDDYPSVIENFIIRRNITNRVLWLDESDADYFCPRIDPRWSGSIPATLMVNPRTGYRRFYEQQLTEKQLTTAISELLHVGI
ncbi:MAG: TlpA disulfide reductase family protein [Chitinophagaceae bacterium]